MRYADGNQWIDIRLVIRKHKLRVITFDGRRLRTDKRLYHIGTLRRLLRRWLRRHPNGKYEHVPY